MARVLVIPGIARRDRVVVKPRIVIDQAKLSFVEERGWTGNGHGYRGQYQARHGSWWGEAQPDGGHLNFFIYAPPQAVLEGPHGPCFQHIGNNWWWVHFSRESPNPSDGIMEIERVLDEAFQR